MKLPSNGDRAERAARWFLQMCELLQHDMNDEAKQFTEETATVELIADLAALGECVQVLQGVVTVNVLLDKVKRAVTQHEAARNN